MTTLKNKIDYWFTIEPFVYVSIKNNHALLYNTLDGKCIESNKTKVIELLRKTLQKENCGVILLTNELFNQEEINSFVQELREKYMGDIIAVGLSNGKPVQLMPFYNLTDDVSKLCKKHNFPPEKKILNNLSEVTIHIDHSTDITVLIPFLQSIPGDFTLNIIGNIENVKESLKLLSFFEQFHFQKNMICHYTNITDLHPILKNKFSYIILVQFPVDIQQWEKSVHILFNRNLPFEYILEVSSSSEYKQAKELIRKYDIKKYKFRPIYTGDNIDFFEKNIFLTKEDILSSPMSIKDFFVNQSMNIYNFGKINIKPNGNVYANTNHPTLGNISTHSIYEIVYKEIEEGRSWLNIRNQAPCNNCVYQWFCPSPSDYEIIINRPNLCHVSQ